MKVQRNGVVLYQVFHTNSSSDIRSCFSDESDSKLGPRESGQRSIGAKQFAEVRLGSLESVRPYKTARRGDIPTKASDYS